MTKNELRDLLKSKIQENNGRTPHLLILDDGEYCWCGGQKIGSGQLYRYRKMGVINGQVQEKQILLV